MVPPAGTNATTRCGNGSAPRAKPRNAPGPRHWQATNSSATEAVMRQPIALSTTGSRGFQNNSYLPPTSASNSAAAVAAVNHVVRNPRRTQSATHAIAWPRSCGRYPPERHQRAGERLRPKGVSAPRHAQQPRCTTAPTLPGRHRSCPRQAREHVCDRRHPQRPTAPLPHASPITQRRSAFRGGDRCDDLSNLGTSP